MRHGIAAIEWTFDPLVRRNAHFNLAKLGARAIEYVENFYGGMRDAINAGDESDRLLVRWELTGPRLASDGVPDEVAAALLADAEGRPVCYPIDASVLTVQIPDDIEAMRAGESSLVREWRLAVRQVLGGLMARGAVVTGFDRRAGYLVATGQAAATEKDGSS